MKPLPLPCLMVFTILLIQGCDPGESTLLFVSNDLGNSAEVKFYGFPAKNGVVDTTFLLGSKGRIYLDGQSGLSNSLLEFDCVSRHFDSIKVVSGTRKSTRDFKKEQEWTFVKKGKHGYSWEYTLVIDDADF